MTRTNGPNGVKGAGFLVLLVALLLAATWLFFKAFIVASAVTGALAAVLIRRWHTRHPSVLPYSPGARVPEINLSRIPVGGDIAVRAGEVGLRDGPKLVRDLWAGEDIVDFGMGNPDLPTPPHVVAKLIEAAAKPQNHRYSVSRGIYKLRLAIVAWYKRRYNVDLDPDAEAIVTIGAKEGISHLAWATIDPGDVVLCPSPTYPIHQFAVVLAGGDLRCIPLTTSEAFFGHLEEAIRRDPNYAPAYAYLGWLNLIDLLLGLTGEWGPSRLGEVIGQFNRAIELDSSLSSAHQGLSQALIHAGDIERAVAVGRRGVELGPSDADALLFLAVVLFESGALGEALELADKAINLNPLRPAYYCFFHAMILWGNKRYQESLGEFEECLRSAPNFRGADTYRVMCLAGLRRLDEAKKLLARLMASPSGLLVLAPKPPELASRALAQLHEAVWRPTLATERKAV